LLDGVVAQHQHLKTLFLAAAAAAALSLFRGRLRRLHTPMPLLATR
jgi:hypothetical protein